MSRAILGVATIAAIIGCFLILKRYNKKKTTKSFQVHHRIPHKIDPIHCTPIENCLIDKVQLFHISHLSKYFPSVNEPNCTASHDSAGEYLQYSTMSSESDYILTDIVRCGDQETECRAYIRGGPRPYLHFNPTTVVAAIVTCGGLCPGLNNVVREIVNSLYSLYSVRKVYGIRGGLPGFYSPDLPPIELNPSVVSNIHHFGGTFLGSTRGGFDLEKIIDFLRSKKINQLYIIGGDGTHRAADRIHVECIHRKLNIAIAAVPKTIDDDIALIDRSFGFTTAVEAAQQAIRCAKTEAICNLPNGIGIVKLMGRSAGFIAAYATLASGDVDLCIIPEIPIVISGDKSFLNHLEQRVADSGHAVVVVAEGAGEDVLGESKEVDASGNRKLPAIGEWLKEKISLHFAAKGKPVSVKYIDPSYMIRSVPANAFDSIYCMMLAQNAVHGAMAGYSGFTVGLCNNRIVYIPIQPLVAVSPIRLDPYGRTWERVVCVTKQPNTVPIKENTSTKVGK